jgi:hypothetical protein
MQPADETGTPAQITVDDPIGCVVPTRDVIIVGHVDHGRTSLTAAIAAITSLSLEGVAKRLDVDVRGLAATIAFESARGAKLTEFELREIALREARLNIKGEKPMADKSPKLDALRLMREQQAMRNTAARVRSVQKSAKGSNRPNKGPMGRKR